MIEEIQRRLGVRLQVRNYFGEECWEIVGWHVFDGGGEPRFENKRGRMKKAVAEWIFKVRRGQIWRTCCNPRCLNPCHFDIVQNGETNLMARMGWEYWRKRKFFVAKGYVPGNEKKRRKRIEKKINRYRKEFKEQTAHMREIIAENK